MKNNLRIESSKDDFKEVWLVEYLVCGGRGFFGILCMKCKFSTYNLAIGVCLYAINLKYWVLSVIILTK